MLLNVLLIPETSSPVAELTRGANPATSNKISILAYHAAVITRYLCFYVRMYEMYSNNNDISSLATAALTAKQSQLETWKDSDN